MLITGYHHRHRIFDGHMFRHAKSAAHKLLQHLHEKGLLKKGIEQLPHLGKKLAHAMISKIPGGKMLEKLIDPLLDKAEHALNQKLMHQKAGGYDHIHASQNAQTSRAPLQITQ